MARANQGKYVKGMGSIGARVGLICGYSRYSDRYHVQWRVGSPSVVMERHEFVIYRDQAAGKGAWKGQYLCDRDTIATSKTED